MGLARKIYERSHPAFYYTVPRSFQQVDHDELIAPVDFPEFWAVTLVEEFLGLRLSFVSIIHMKRGP